MLALIKNVIIFIVLDGIISVHVSHLPVSACLNLLITVHKDGFRIK